MSSILKIFRRIGGTKATPTSGEEGQLAVYKAGKATTDAASLYFHDGVQWVELLDTKGKVVSTRSLTIGTTAPATPANTDLWLNSTTNLLSVWDGAAWASTNPHPVSTAATAPATPFTGALWLDPAKKELKIWDGAQWSNVAFTNVSNTFIQPQNIDVTSTSAALHIKQLGTGAALLVEDEANPDTTPFVVNASGNVGVGIQSPSAKLQVKGVSKAAGISNISDLNAIRIDGSLNGPGYTGITFQDGGGGAAISMGRGNGYDTSISFYTNSVSSAASGAIGERMRINSEGDVGIGSNQPTHKLEVIASHKTAVHAALVAGSPGVTYPLYAHVNATKLQAVPGLRIVKADPETTPANVFIQFAVNQDGTNTGQINANGANTAAFGSYSDKRLKERIHDLPSQIGNIMKLRPVEFDYKGFPTGEGHQIGFIAQEMQSVYPDSVSEGADGMLMITAWSKTEARLVKAIQDQQDIINSLIARIEKLEARP